MFYTSVPHQHLHSFPTRRSSDLEGLPRPGVLGVDRHRGGDVVVDPVIGALVVVVRAAAGDGVGAHVGDGAGDRKSTRLNSSHVAISYAVFCLKKKTRQRNRMC